MNIAFSALLLLLTLLPGIAFRFSYLKSNSIRKSLDSSLLNEAVFVVIPALLLHLIGVWALELTTSYSFHFDQFYYLLVPSKGGDNLDLNLIGDSIYIFTTYIALVSISAIIIASLIRKIVVKRGWDQAYKVLRVYNEWDLYFTGAVLDEETRATIDYVQVDVAVSIGGSSILYTGVLESYTLNDEQSIDQLTMSQVFRRELSDDRNAGGDVRGAAGALDGKGRYYEMPGNYFILPFENVQNFNITYIQLSDDPIPPGAYGEDQPVA